MAPALNDDGKVFVFECFVSESEWEDGDLLGRRVTDGYPDVDFDG